MPEKFEPLQFEALLTYAWVVGLSAWGGMAEYVRKIKTGAGRFSFSALIGELCVSAFVGVITYLLCQSAQINPVTSAAFVGISGHMGSRAILIFEKFVQKKIERWLGNENDKY
jgi:D-arabinose 1-dehydrogenase-like Zn-dependent alcohol dehydrogenase